MVYKKKDKQRNTIVGIILIFLFLIVISQNKNRELSVVNLEEISELELPCYSEDSCLQYLNSEGMPEGYLEENNLMINCEGGKCVLKEK